MARGGKVGRKSSGRKKAGSTYRASDESDEDYAVDEEFDESEDGYSSFVGDDSEESLGEFEDEELEGLKRTKVKKVLRSRVPRRNKKGIARPRKRKRVSYREDDDDDDEDDDRVDEDDEEFRPDCLDEEEEFPVTKETKNSSKPRLHKGTARYDNEEEDEDVEELKPDGLDEEEEFPVVKGMRKSSRSRRRKGIVKDDNTDEDEEDEGDEEFTPDGLDEEEDFPIMKERKNSSKQRLQKGTAKDDDEVDEDDEEFNPDGLDEEEDFPVMKEMKNSSKQRLHKGTAKDDDEVDEDDEEFNPDCSDEEEDLLVMKEMKKSSRSRRRKGTAKADNVDEDEEDVDDEEFTPDGLDEEEDLPVMKEMNSSKQRLHKRTAGDDDEEDEDDEEFTPDSLDEEEEFPVMKGMKYSSKPRLRKGTAKEQKRNRNLKELKITRKKPLKRRRLKRKARSENDKEFIDVDPVVEEKNKKNAGRRRKGKRLGVNSDSDFVVSSGSSDRDFTISEEEREQVREASQFCRGLATPWKGSTSLKNTSKDEAPRVLRKHPGRKAKEKVEVLKTEAGKQICGICLSEEGKRTIRGTLNCCSHYFCFACIMEWSKVESRCPLCKQRFATISKPARSDTGFDLRTVVIQVPERDQVYQPSEEELRGYLDPYENVLCTECQQGGDDAFMLLCDLCDSPAHTYCVGLGREVPEGNWYCESCRPTALASLNPQRLNPMPDNRTSSSFSVGSPPVANVRETFDLNEMYVPDTPLAEESGDFQSPRDGQGASLYSGVGAFTVSDRRRIQRQIHQLLNNRRRQLGNITGTFGAVSGNSLFGSQIARSRELATQPAVLQMVAPNSTFFQGRQPENSAHFSHNWISLIPDRSSNLSGQLNLNGASTSSQSFFGEFLDSELQGTDASISLGLVHQQLHPCSSRSNVGPDTSTSPCQFRESTVPARTLPSTLRRPF